MYFYLSYGHYDWIVYYVQRQLKLVLAMLACMIITVDDAMNNLPLSGLQNPAADLLPRATPATLLRPAPARGPRVPLPRLRAAVLQRAREAGGGQRALAGPQPRQRLPHVALVLSVLQPRLHQLLAARGDLDRARAVESAGPVLEGDAGVAEVGVLEGEHLEAGGRLRSGYGAVGTQLQWRLIRIDKFILIPITSNPSQRLLMYSFILAGMSPLL